MSAVQIEAGRRTNVRRRHLVSLTDLSTDELVHLARRSAAFARGEALHSRPLAGRVVGTFFRKTSTRTRTAFTVAAMTLGASVIAYGSDDLQLSTGESIDDTGEVLGRMLDAIVVRSADDPAQLRAWTSQSRMAVVNAMTADEHPTQAIADLTTLVDRFGSVEGLRVLYVGEGNSTAAALALALARFPGVEAHFRTPLGYGLAPDKRLRAERDALGSGAFVGESHSPRELPPEVDVVYTTRWQTTGSTKTDPQWRAAFEAFRVDERLLERYPDAVFMHDLPAHRGEEVVAAVLDGPQSIAFDQAENKLHSAKAILEWCLSAVER